MAFEIMADILNRCFEQSSKTRIMYRSNLSYEAANRYINTLTSLELLRRNRSSRKYQTTSKGEEFLMRWSGLNEFLITGTEDGVTEKQTAKSYAPHLVVIR